MKQPDSLISFKRITHAYHVAYTLSNVGMKNLLKEVKEMEGVNPDGMFQIGEGDENKLGISEIPTKMAFAGMEKDGPNSQLIAHGLIVLIYETWNESYRSKIASELGWKTNEVMCDVMGDVRVIRNWIAHNGSVADGDVSKLKALKWPNETGPFAFKSDNMKNLQLALNTMQIYRRDA
jgi:hypothetical protein